jgi:hypothetical protein
VSPVVEALTRVACEEKRLVAVKAEDEALDNVVSPVTLSAEEKDPVVPMSAP